MYSESRRLSIMNNNVVSFDFHLNLQFENVLNDYFGAAAGAYFLSLLCVPCPKKNRMFYHFNRIMR